MGFGCCCSGKTCKNAGTEIVSTSGSPHGKNYQDALNAAGLSSQFSAIQGGGTSSSFSYGIDASNDYLAYAAGDAGIVYQKIGEGALQTESLGFSTNDREQDAYDYWSDENIISVVTGTSNGSRYGFESSPFTGAYDVCFISQKEILVACGLGGVKYFNLEKKEQKQYLSGGSTIIRNIAKHKSYIITGTAGYTNPVSGDLSDEEKAWAYPESVYVNVDNKSGGEVNIYKVKNNKLELQTSTSVSGSVNDICSGSKDAYVAFGSITTDDGSSSTGGLSKIVIKSENNSVSATAESVYSSSAVMGCQAEGEDVYYVADSESVLYKNGSPIGQNINFKQTKFCVKDVDDDFSECFGFDYEAEVVLYDIYWEELTTFKYCFDSGEEQDYEHSVDQVNNWFNWWGGCPMGIAVTKDEKGENGQTTKEGKIYISLWQKGIVVCSKEGQIEKRYENFGGDNDDFCSSFGGKTKNWGTTIFSGKMTCNNSGVYVTDCFQAVANDCGPNIYHPLMKKLYFYENDFGEQPLLGVLNQNGDYGVGLITF